MSLPVCRAYEVIKSFGMFFSVFAFCPFWILLMIVVPLRLTDIGRFSVCTAILCTAITAGASHRTQQRFRVLVGIVVVGEVSIDAFFLGIAILGNT